MEAHEADEPGLSPPGGSSEEELAFESQSARRMDVGPGSDGGPGSEGGPDSQTGPGSQRVEKEELRPAASIPAVDPLVSLLLPVLLHKLNNATQLLTGVHALMQLVPDEDSMQRHGEDLAHTSRKVDDLGWLLALVASVGGANLMLERREERGLDLLLSLLADAMRRGGVQLDPTEMGCRLAPSAQGGWQLPWAVGALLHAAARPLLRDSLTLGRDLQRLEWTLVSRAEETWISVQTSEDLAQYGALLAQRLPQAQLVLEGERVSLVVPTEWLPPVVPPLEA